ncbi:MAG: MurT ligase domain-containing protein [Clostridia bacterium]|nr:MurT ligase domain-containing protein [Clostridia bacterium]
MRMLIAVWITKILILAGKFAGKKGSSTPGIFAMKIFPDILKFLAKQVKNDIIVVCGTNGKTTTNNLLNTIIKSAGKNVVCNNVGANMLPGVVTAFIEKTNLLGKLDADYGCIEIDEISTVKVFPYFEPDYMIITNLFRDQLDRYGEIETTMNYMQKALDMCENTKLILNADDPLVASFGKRTDKPCYYFGVGEDVGISLNETKEGRFCMFCNDELKYDFYHYSQLGMYRCDKCGFKRPEVDFEAKNVNLNTGISFSVNEQNFNVKYRGFYNIYNILAAYSAITLCGLKADNINDILCDYKPQTGRMEEFNIKGKQVIFNLAKNPAGFNQAISTVLGDKRKKNIITVINDNAGDGKDVSWLWDVDFERFNNINANKFYVSGIRRDDVAVRFKYAEIVDFECSDNVKDAILKALDEECDVLYILVNYTALFSTHDILKSLEEK